MPAVPVETLLDMTVVAAAAWLANGYYKEQKDKESREQQLIDEHR